MSFKIKQNIFRFTDLASQTALDTSIDEESPIPPGQGNVENFTKHSIWNNLKKIIVYCLSLIASKNETKLLQVKF